MIPTTIAMADVYVLERLLHDYMSFHIDWAAINPYSPDYIKDYVPNYPPVVRDATAVIRKLREAALQGGAQ